jgi:hypothetical protein
MLQSFRERTKPPPGQSYVSEKSPKDEPPDVQINIPSASSLEDVEPSE